MIKERLDRENIHEVDGELGQFWLLCEESCDLNSSKVDHNCDDYKQEGDYFQRHFEVLLSQPRIIITHCIPNDY